MGVADVRIENHGSLFLVRPQNSTAREWIDDNVSVDGPWQWFGGALAVEGRYVVDLVNGMRQDGLVVR